MVSLLDIHNTYKLKQLNNGGMDKEIPKKIARLYNPILGKFRITPIKILEIGVRVGGSTKLWLSLLQNADFYALDNGTNIFLDSIENTPILNNFTFMNLDVYSKEAVSQIPDDHDFVIDDGPHTLESQKYFIKNYIYKLKKLGIIFVEDIQASHWLDELILVIPRDFRGCIRIVDLRRETGVGDALVLVIHNCNPEDCTIEIENRDLNRKMVRLVALLRIRKISYLIKRLLLKMRWKSRNVLGPKVN